MTDSQSRIDELLGLIADLDEQLPSLDGRMRQEAERGRDIAEQMIVALEHDDREDLERIVGEEFRKVPRGIRGTDRLARAQEFIRVVTASGTPQVWVRWDAIPDEDTQADVVSLASIWKDTIKSRPIGRPRKSTRPVKGGPLPGA